MHGLPVSCPFNFPNGNLKQQLSHIGAFICYQNIDAEDKLNLHIYGIHLLNPHKTVVSHLKYQRTHEKPQPFFQFAYVGSVCYWGMTLQSFCYRVWKIQTTKRHPGIGGTLHLADFMNKHT